MGYEVKLTPRQADVLRGIVAGDTNYQIARTLGIAEATVKKVNEVLFDKMGVTSRTQAAVLAVLNGYVK